MGVCAVDNLHEGMVLNSDVHDRSGRLLLGHETVLVGKHLRMFRMWGVTEVDIAGGDDPLVAASEEVVDGDPEALKAAEDVLRPLFRNANLSHPAMAELFRLCLLRKVNYASRH